MSLIQIDPLATGVGGEFTPDSVGTTTLLTPGAAAIDLIAAQGGASEAVCALDNCCESGGYNTGIAVARSTGDVYVTNECPTGKVLHFNAAGALVSGGAIDIGTFPSGINVSVRTCTGACVVAFLSSSSNSRRIIDQPALCGGCDGPAP